MTLIVDAQSGEDPYAAEAEEFLSRLRDEDLEMYQRMLVAGKFVTVERLRPKDTRLAVEMFNEQQRRREKALRLIVKARESEEGKGEFGIAVLDALAYLLGA